MKREIKFKAKRIDNGEWVEGDLLQNNGNPVIVIQVERNYISTSHINMSGVAGGKHWHIETHTHRVDPETVCQFTGLYDKNYSEIWEGDKLHRHMGVVWVVNFRYSRYVADSDDDSGIYLDANQFGECEIVGNIHDNPQQ